MRKFVVEFYMLTKVIMNNWYINTKVFIIRFQAYRAFHSQFHRKIYFQAEWLASFSPLRKQHGLVKSSIVSCIPLNNEPLAFFFFLQMRARLRSDLDYSSQKSPLSFLAIKWTRYQIQPIKKNALYTGWGLDGSQCWIYGWLGKGCAPTNEAHIIKQAGGKNRAKWGPARAGASSHSQIFFSLLGRIWPNGMSSPVSGKRPLRTITSFSNGDFLFYRYIHTKKCKIGQVDKPFVYIINNSHLSFCISLEVVVSPLTREDKLYFCSAPPYYVQQ